MPKPGHADTAAGTPVPEQTCGQSLTEPQPCDSLPADSGSGPNSAQSPVEALAGKMTALLLVRIAKLEARLRDLREHLDRLSDETTAVMVKVGVDNSPDPTSIDHQLRDHASRLDSIEDHLATAATDLVQRILAAQEPEPRGFLDRLTASPDGPPYTHRVTDTSGPYFTIEDSDAEEGPR